MNVFTYGSLMFPEVWRCVTGSGLEGQPARLREFEARAIRGQTYPALISKPGAVTEGVVYSGVNAEAVARLDVFEGNFYQRQTVVVRTGSGAEEDIEAQVYVAVLADHPDILPERWRADEFRNRHLAGFLRTDPGFRGER